MKLTIRFKRGLPILLTALFLGTSGFGGLRWEGSEFATLRFGTAGRLEAEENRTDSEGNVRRVLSEDGQTEAEAELTPSCPRLSETLTLTLRAACPPNYSAVFPDFGERYGSFLVESAEKEPSAISGGREESVLRLTLLPTEKGEETLLPIPVAFKTAEGGKNRSLLIPAGKATIESDLNPEDVSLSQLSGSRGSLASPYPWLWGGIALLAAALLAFILFRYRAVWKRRRGTTVVSLSPSERALKRLEELKASGIHRTDVRRFYLALTEIVRQFIEETTGIRAPEQTTEEFLRAVEIDSQKSFDDAFRRELARFLEFSDLVKFAKFHPTPEEIEAGYRRAEEVARYSFATSESAKNDDDFSAQG